MKKAKKSLYILLACMIILVVFPLQTFAVGKIDLDQKASLTVDYQYEGMPIPEADFDIFYLATVDEYVKFTLTDVFKDYPISVDDHTVEEWNELADTLKGYVIDDGLTPDYTITTDEFGQKTLENLTPGLYLVIGQKCMIGDFTYTTTPSIVCLPNADEAYAEWFYDVTIFPKASEIFPEISQKVIKIWKDDDDQKENRPKEITVKLYCDKEEYEAVTLSSENDWQYTWDELPKYDDNKKAIEWTLTEETKAKDYTVKVEKDGTTFVVTNTYEEPYTPPDIPQTGLLWWPVPILAGLGIICLIIGVIRRRRSH
ncbi:MAG: Cna B-type domain-containing protein [Lachnospiraceae bacterium]|nr:Cna B-type domain-containing protein [Lachnospiraceae bacterium]